MKMRYSRRANSVSPVLRLGAFALLLVVVMVLLLRFLLPDVFVSLGASVWKFGTAGTMLMSEERPRTAEEELLVNENAALRARLRDVGAERSVPEEVGLLAGVLSRPPMSPYDVLVVDRGSQHGIREGNQVYALGVPIGSVSAVYERSSRVLLYSAPERFTEGWIGESRLPVTLIGASAGAYEADVPREAGVVEGDSVYLPGPGALPVGHVVRIESHASAPRAVLRIRPIVNVFRLTWVRIMP